MTGPGPTIPWKLPPAPGGTIGLAAGCLLNARAISPPASLPVPAFAGGTEAITTTPIVGTPRRPGLVKPRMAGLWYTLLSPQVFTELGAVYDGPVVQTQDLTVFNVTREAVVARQAKVSPQLPPIPGVPRVPYTPSQSKSPAWWAEALIPVD